jgi:hypothetical protein
MKPNSVEMIIALDRSLSMQNSAFDSTTRLQAAIQGIAGAVTGHPRIQVDLELFPGAQGCDGQVGTPVSVQTESRNNPSALEKLMACGSDSSACPTAGNNSPSHAALQKCRRYFENQTGQGSMSQVVLLVTDQDPTCEGDGASNDWLCTQATGEAARMMRGSVQIFVVSLGNATSTGCLAAIAAGNAPNGSSQFVAATGEQQLRTALDAIMEAVLCRFSVARAPMSVTLNNQPVPLAVSGQEGGWSFDASSHGLVLSGSFCKDLMTSPDAVVPVVQDCSPP